MSRTLYARILLCGFAAAAGLGHAALTTDVPPTPCRTVDVGEDSNATAHDAAELLDAGWTGRAGDGAERLYSPECESESARTVSSPTDRDAPGANH